VNNFALFASLLLVSGIGAPALAQSSRPAAKKRALKERSLELVHTFLVALERGKVDKAMAVTATPFLMIRKGKRRTFNKKELLKLFGSEDGRELGRRAAMFRKKDAKRVTPPRMTPLYWGPKSARAKKTVGRFPEFEGCGWVGIVYRGKKRRAEEANDPFAIKLVGKQLKIVGLHVDPALLPPPVPGSLASFEEAEALAAKGRAAFKACVRARVKGTREEFRKKHREAKGLLREAIEALNDALDPNRKKDGALPKELEGHEMTVQELSMYLIDVEKMGRR
jgi:hypothetical protein